MDLLDLTLQSSSSVVLSKSGDYSRDYAKNIGAEFVFAKPGGVIELYSSDAETGALKLLSSSKVFATVRSLDNYRVQGSKRDQIVVGTDSGAITLFRFEGKSGSYAMVQVQCETFGKTGVRRVVPGQYVTAEPKGRAIMVAAVEKQKLVYVMNRDSGGRTTISSPLEAHKSSTITFDVKAIDVGFDNPVFAALELSYADSDADGTKEAAAKATKQLTYYELDLGLNHVTRRWTKAVARKACLLAPLPGGSDGPSGVLVCGEDYISYHDESQADSDVTVLLPRRSHHPTDSPVMVTSVTVHKQKKNKFFAICQTELGDAYKISVDFSDDTVTGLRAQLIDTLPLAVSLNVTKMGLLFLAAEFGDHLLYQLNPSIIDLPGSVEMDSAATAKLIPGKDYNSANAAKHAPTFTPSTTLSNMRVVDTINSISATTGLLVGEYTGNEVSPQMYTLCGRGPRSSMRVLRHGAAINQLAVSDLPGTPSAIFSVKGEDDDDKYIVVSFKDATLVLSVGESVEEVSDTAFVTDAPTIACSKLADGGMVQVHPNGVRHIKADGKTFKDWQCPGLKKIEYASCNTNQVLIAFESQVGEICYFELDESMNLAEKVTKDLEVEITCLDIGVIPKGRNRSLFAVIGGVDDTVRVLSLSPQDYLSERSSAVVQGRPSSICVVDMANEKGTVDKVLNVGTVNGIMQQTTIDSNTGALSGNPTKRFLGAKKVEATRVMVDGKICSLLLSSRPWLSFVSNNTGSLTTTPLSYTTLDHVCGFSSEIVNEGIVATAGSTLHILTIENIESVFNETVVPLRYTPRQTCLISGKIALVEADANDTSEAHKADTYGGTGSKKTGAGDGMDMDDSDNEESEASAETTTTVRGPIPSSKSSWGSCLRLLDPKTASTVDLLELSESEAALSCCAVQFASQLGEVLLAVGVSKALQFRPVKAEEHYVNIYRVTNNRLSLMHSTKVGGVVLSMTQFQNKLLVGVGGMLRLYDVGKKQLLRKCEKSVSKTIVKCVACAGDRIYVGDMSNSVQILKFDPERQIMNLVCEDTMPRSIVSMCVLDIDTVCASDRFGNVVVLRSPKNAVEESVVVDDAGLWGRKVGAQFDTLCQYHVGEIVTSVKKASLVQGGAEAIVYVTITGKIGALLPLVTKDDVEFFHGLQAELRKQAPRPVGMNFGKYRGTFFPAKRIIDGDLISLWNNLSGDKQKEIAEELDRSVADISKKIEQAATKLL
mmetsp:Transcript_10419/g.21430  ORF Transcript_10419/g.21430 Transcript_10419/m.21430 type:complete len:1222 (+) Transcript_10419:121-3786(+)